MSLILLLLGILIAGAGIAMIGFGIPINDLLLGSTLIIAGATALTGGLILIGLSAAVTELTRIADALRPRPGARAVARPAESPEAVAPAAVAPVAAAAAPPGRPRQTPRAPMPPQPIPETPRAEAPRAEAPRAEAPRPAVPAPPGPSAVEVSAAAIERLRSSIPRAERPRVEPSVVAEGEDVPLSPNGAAHYAQPRPPSPEPPVEPRVSAEDRASDAAVDTGKRSRLDFLFRSRTARPAPQTENFDTVWPSDAPPPRSREPELPVERTAAAEVVPPVEQRRAEPEPAPTGQRSAAILKSGVVDGMAYTLYADGSIEAKLPHGTVRFGSIAELRAHIENNS